LAGTAVTRTTIVVVESEAIGYQQLLPSSGILNKERVERKENNSSGKPLLSSKSREFCSLQTSSCSE